jgi:hypothetical protein
MNHWSLFKLEIVGFASVIGPDPLPRILPPVFRSRENEDIFILPPFAVSGDEVFNATQVGRSDFEALVDKGSITPLDTAIPADTNRDLWVDAEGQIHYDLKSTARKAFEQIFEKHLALAQESLDAREYAAVGRHTAIARAVKPSHLNPLVLRATAEKLADKHQEAAFTRHIASAYVSPAEFDQLVKARIGDEGLAEAHGAGVMKGIVMRRSRAQAA